jgi:hydroxymethylbilane synthase
MKSNIILGSRGSRLAILQAEEIKKLLLEKFPKLFVDIKTISTEGDKDTDKPLSEFGGRGAFVTSLENALLEGKIDAAVHSLKDLPSNLPKGLTLCAAPLREDIRDVIVSKTGLNLKTLPQKSIIGTGSERRILQLKKLRPDFNFKNIRGNIETRLDKITSGEYDAVVIAAAAMKRLGMTSLITEYINEENYLPAPCQGAIGVECLETNKHTLSVFSEIDDPKIRICVDAERTFISTLGMGCHAPVGAYGQISGGGVSFRAFTSSGNGNIIFKKIQAPKGGIINAVRDLAIQMRMAINKELTK